MFLLLQFSILETRIHCRIRHWWIYKFTVLTEIQRKFCHRFLNHLKCWKMKALTGQIHLFLKLTTNVYNNNFIRIIIVIWSDSQYPWARRAWLFLRRLRIFVSKVGIPCEFSNKHIYIDRRILLFKLSQFFHSYF